MGSAADLRGSETSSSWSRAGPRTLKSISSLLDVGIAAFGYQINYTTLKEDLSKISIAISSCELIKGPRAPAASLRTPPQPRLFQIFPRKERANPPPFHTAAWFPQGCAACLVEPARAASIAETLATIRLSVTARCFGQRQLVGFNLNAGFLRFRFCWVFFG